MVKNGSFWAGFVFSVIVMAGSVFVPALTGAEFVASSVYSVLPVAIVSYVLVQHVLSLGDYKQVTIKGALFGALAGLVASLVFMFLFVVTFLKF